MSNFKTTIMRTMEFILIFSFFSMVNQVNSQNQNLPEIDIYTLDGERVSTNEVCNSGQSTVIIFWKSNDKTSLEQISMINEEYENSLKDKNVKVIGICLDASGNMASIKPFVFGNNIDFEMYIDKNGDLKRAMNVSEFPYTIVINKINSICHEPIGYYEPVVDLLENSVVNDLATMKDN